MIPAIQHDQEWFSQSVGELLAHRFHISLTPVKILGANYAGWLQTSPRSLTIATKHRWAYQVFIHEFCHFLQWRDDRKWFCRNSRLLDLPKAAKANSVRKVTNICRSIMEVEADCERRAVAIIEQRLLSIPLGEYRKIANANVMIYHGFMKFHCWPEKSYTKAALALCPTDRLWPDIDQDTQDQIVSKMRW